MPQYTLTTTAQNIGVGPIIVQATTNVQYLYTTVAMGGTPNAADFVYGNYGGELEIIKHNHTNRELYARLANTSVPVSLAVAPG